MNAEARTFPPQAGPRFTEIRLLTDNVDAWQAKRDLIGRARQSLDLVYFIMDFDGTTSRLAMDLVAAARRGVRIRLLVDHFMTFLHAPALRALAGEPNIEVRRFRPPSPAWLEALRAAGIDAGQFVRGLASTNPALLAEATRQNTILPAEWFVRLHAMQPEADESRVQFALRVVAAVQEVLKERADAQGADGTGNAATESFARLREKVSLTVRVVGGLKRFLRRTHHKLLLADRCWFIMGGRNMADAYQRSDPPQGRPFADIDLCACDRTGEAREHVAAFDALWREELSADIRQPDALDDRAALDLHAIEVMARGSDDLPNDYGEPRGHLLPDMDGQIVNNLPSADGGDAAITQAYVEYIHALADRGQPAVVDVTNAYLCLTHNRADSPTLCALRQALLDAARAGVTVRLRTNSPITTDLKMVNIAAYPGLLELIDGGVQVWELEEGQGSLHAKVAMIDDECLFVGSYNFDPRSELFDTNNLIVLHDPTGAACRVLRKTAVDARRWKLLRKEDIDCFIAAEENMALEFRSVRTLL